MRVLKAIVLIVGISAFFYGLFFIGGAFTGAGHGTSYFLEAVVAPFSMLEILAPLGILFWPEVAVLLALRRISACRVAATMALAIHYVGVTMLSLKTDWSYVAKAWNAFPIMIVAFILAYLFSQAFMWWLITKKQKDHLTDYQNKPA